MSSSAPRDRHSRSTITIRDSSAADLDALLDLNLEWEHVTSALTPAALQRLHERAALRRVAEIDGAISGFLLAFGPGVEYESLNYRWFDSRYEEFLYIDRVVVSAQTHRAGIGTALYADAFNHATARSMARVVCEIDIDPPNAASAAFHDRWGFVEVGTQVVAGGTKRVSLRERVLSSPTSGS